jgi:hypothetical protein
MANFNTDVFHFETLTGAVQDVAYMPQRVSELGWFSEEGIDTTDVRIDFGVDSVQLVPVKERGGDPLVRETGKFKSRNFSTFHLPESSSIQASELQNVRAIGKATETDAVLAKITKKLKNHKRDIMYTQEHMRMGAVTGIIYDADGTTPLLNLFTEMGVSKSTATFNLATSTKIRSDVVAVKRQIKTALGGVGFSGVRVLCSPEYFDAFIENGDVKEQYLRYNGGEQNRNDVRGGFVYGGVIFEEYEGTSLVKIPDGKALAVPEGVDGLFQSFYAPADYNETVNSEGLPMYSKGWEKYGGKGWTVETQSNPLHICSRPTAIIELSNA